MLQEARAAAQKEIQAAKAEAQEKQAKRLAEVKAVRALLPLCHSPEDRWPLCVPCTSAQVGPVVAVQSLSGKSGTRQQGSSFSGRMRRANSAVPPCGAGCRSARGRT